MSTGTGKRTQKQREADSKSITKFVQRQFADENSAKPTDGCNDKRN